MSIQNSGHAHLDIFIAGIILSYLALRSSLFGRWLEMVRSSLLRHGTKEGTEASKSSSASPCWTQYQPLFINSIKQNVETDTHLWKFLKTTDEAQHVGTRIIPGGVSSSSYIRKLARPALILHLANKVITV